MQNGSGAAGGLDLSLRPPSGAAFSSPLPFPPPTRWGRFSRSDRTARADPRAGRRRPRPSCRRVRNLDVRSRRSRPAVHGAPAGAHSRRVPRSATFHQYLRDRKPPTEAGGKARERHAHLPHARRRLQRPQHGEVTTRLRHRKPVPPRAWERPGRDEIVDPGRRDDLSGGGLAWPRELALAARSEGRGRRARAQEDPLAVRGRTSARR